MEVAAWEEMQRELQWWCREKKEEYEGENEEDPRWVEQREKLRDEYYRWNERTELSRSSYHQRRERRKGGKEGGVEG